MMSGGLDSASIVAMALRDRSWTKIEAFSVVGDEENGEESRSIGALANMPRVEAHRVSVPSCSGELGIADLIDIAWSGAHPVDNTLLIPAMMCKAASRRGHSVVLDGASGDVAFATPRYYPEALLRRFEFAKLWRESGLAGRNNVYLLGRSRWNVLARSAYEVAVPTIWRSRVNKWFRSGDRQPEGLINPDFRDRVCNEISAERDEQQLLTLSQPKLISDLVMSGNVGFGRVARRFGIQATDPWADRRVVEFFFGLPVEYKIRDGWTKYPVRALFSEDLHSSVLWRRDKEHLGWKAEQRVMQASLAFVVDTLEAQLHRVAAYVDAANVRSALDDFQASGGLARAQELYALMSLIIWLERVDCESM
jgi:asparagine synthase (glutamine-hydrolysing)